MAMDADIYGPQLALSMMRFQREDSVTQARIDLDRTAQDNANRLNEKRMELDTQKFEEEKQRAEAHDRRAEQTV